MQRHNINIPDKFIPVLSQDDLGLINVTAAKFGKIYEDNRLYFFPEYTNHGIAHIEDVLKTCSELISDESYNLLDSKDITVLIFSVILHDLGMHINKESLLNLILEDTSPIAIPGFDKRTWKEEWTDFLHEAKRFNEVKLEQIFGDKDITIVDYDFDNKEEYSKKLLGEFLRRMHPRLAHEIAILGYPTGNGIINFSDDIPDYIKELSGLVARSHGLELRDTFNYLKDKYSKAWSSPHNVKIIYLMTVLRIADYIQIQNSRADRLILQTRRLSSSVSIQEWEKHDAIEFISTEIEDPESVYVHAIPRSSNIFLELQILFKSIQYELDLSWAVLGEVYGRHNFKKLGLKYRRIQSNLDDKDKFQNDVDYIPEKVIFDADPEILKLLIGPLYGEDPTFGIRELLQNSIDAVKEREILEGKGSQYETLVNISLRENEVGDVVLIIQDNGVGMSKDTLINYFFRAGASFRKSDFWQKKFGTSGGQKFERVGRFGVGVLAAYLLGDEITVTTKHFNALHGLSFKAKLASRQIELIKTSADIGTKIEIKLKKEVVDLLSEETPINWFTWYRLRQPEIKFFIDEKFQELFVLNSGPDFVPSSDEQLREWRSFETNSYGKVRWTIDLADSHGQIYGDPEDYLHGNRLLVNGFLIPNGYDLLTTNHSWKPPLVSVFDKRGMMPLSLNRNYIQNNKLPFEKELLEQMARDVIAKILSIEIAQNGSFYLVHRGSRYLNYRNKIDLEQNIIFINGQYTLAIPFILYELGIDTLPTIWVKKSPALTANGIFKGGYITSTSELSSINSYVQRIDGYYSSRIDDHWFSIFGSKSKRNITWKRIFLKKEKFEFLNVGKRLRTRFKSNCEPDNESIRWTSFINKPENYFIHHIQPVDKVEITRSTFDIHDLDNIYDEIDLVVESKFGYYEDEDDIDAAIFSQPTKKAFNVENIFQCRIFEDMLKEYLGADYLIPICFEEREKKFKRAFTELNEQIHFHRTNHKGEPKFRYSESLSYKI